MASFHPNGTYGSHWWGDVDPWVNWQNASVNRSSVHVRLNMRADSGYSQNATTSYNVRINGSQINSGSRNITMSGPNTVTLVEGDIEVTHDANGNWSGSYGGGFASNYSGVGSGSGDWAWSLPRLPLAPTFYGLSVDSIKHNQARLGAELTSLGHGTSANLEMFYRLQGSGSWLTLGIQGDAAGWNYWSVTGLKPGKTYEYICNCTNNNGDFAQTSTYTFKTKGVAGHTPLLIGLS